MNLVAANGDTALDKPPSSSQLKTRLISAFVLAPVALGAVIFGTPWFDLLVALAVCIMAYEWRRMIAGNFDVQGWVFSLAVSASAFSVMAGQTIWGIVLLSATAAILTLVCLRMSVQSAGWMAVGIFTVGLTGIALTWLRHLPETGLLAVLWLLVTIWTTDSAAYFAGRAIGGPKLAPSISPNKTWAGLIGGMSASAVCGAAFGYWTGLFDITTGALAGAVLAILGQAGDLGISIVKRKHSVKDTGNLIPGHGGVLDRVDGLIGTAPLLALVVWLTSGERFGWV